MLNVNRLRILREVAAKGSFSAAAQSRSYTQSAVSQQIATLEAEIGTLLVERRPRGLRLTPAGQALVEHADAIMARLESAEAELASIAGLGGGRLRMASFPTAGATLMPLAVAEFSASHPGVELTLAEGEPEEMAPRLRDGEFDLGLLFRFPGVGAGFDGLHTTDLLEDPLYLALPREHRLAERRTLRLADLAGEAWVQTSVDSPCARHVVRSCHAAGFEPRVSFESDDYLTVQGLVAAGVGVALIPRLALSGVRDDIAVRELSPSSPVRHVLAATVRGAQVPAAAAMLEILRGAAAAYIGEPVR
jgi:DNA-binding transcriptional LysR family regulator